MLLVPYDKKQKIVDLLGVARDKTKYYGDKTYKDIKGTGTLFDCKKAWLQLALIFMQTQKITQNNIDWGIHSSENERFESIPIEKFGIKFILFREVDSFKNMFNPLDFASNVETTFRFGLKGGLHFLGSDENSINIIKIHFDNYEHYRRHLSGEKIIGRLNSLRPYITFSEHDELIDDRSSKNIEVNPRPFNDRELLLLVDLLVGGFRGAIYPPSSKPKRDLARISKQLLDRYYRGYARMQNSRWFNSFCISQCALENGIWKFNTIKVERDGNEYQLPLSGFV